jgi:hypothetical protein
MPRFVLLDHDHLRPHLDLMLEAGDVLWTWRLDAAPEPGPERQAERIADHRPRYLDYEGPVSGNRGSVRRRDRGEFDWLEQEPGRMVLLVRGDTYHGRLTLRQEAGEVWLMLFEPEA